MFTPISIKIESDFVAFYFVIFLKTYPVLGQSIEIEKKITTHDFF